MFDDFSQQLHEIRQCAGWHSGYMSVSLLRDNWFESWLGADCPDMLMIFLSSSRIVL